MNESINLIKAGASNICMLADQYQSKTFRECLQNINSVEQVNEFKLFFKTTPDKAISFLDSKLINEEEMNKIVEETNNYLDKNSVF